MLTPIKRKLNWLHLYQSKFQISLPIFFCLLVLAVIEKEGRNLWQHWTCLFLFSILSSFCFMYFETLLIGAYKFRTVMYSWWIDSYIVMKWLLSPVRFCAVYFEDLENWGCFFFPKYFFCLLSLSFFSADSNYAESRPLEIFLQLTNSLLIFWVFYFGQL